MLYSYTAKNNAGQMVEGKRESDSRLALSRELRAEGLALILARSISGKFDFSTLNNFFVRVKLHDKIIFTRNLSAMLRAGISLARALGILERQTQNFRFKKIMGEVLDGINKGQGLSDGLKKFPGVFSSLFVSMIKAGEESGSLPASLEAVGAQLEKSYVMGKKIRGAMMYPAIVLVAIILIGALMLIYVVPALSETFKSMNVELPKSTQFIIWLSGQLVANTLTFFLSLVALVGLFVFAVRTERGKRVYDSTLLHLPIFGNIIKEVNAARTARTLSSLISAGVEMRQAISITRDVLQNVFYKEIMAEAEKAVEKGLTLSGVFKEKTDLYPVMVGEMVEVGEETGRLSNMLENIASFYEDEVDIVTKDMSSLIEPILMLVIGGAVGFFAISMISPTYSLLNSV